MFASHRTGAGQQRTLRLVAIMNFGSTPLRCEIPFIFFDNQPTQQVGLVPGYNTFACTYQGRKSPEGICDHLELTCRCYDRL
jgi:hypothetical protein